MASTTTKIVLFPFWVMYRICVLFVGIFCLPAAYALRGKFLRGIAVVALLLVIAFLTLGFGLLIAYPMAVADAATC
jgi:hypothetical protein